MAWTEERKKQVIDAYLAKNPTPETSVEICKAIAEEMEESVNSIRMLLLQADVYVKKSADATKGGTGKTTTKKDGDKPARVSKDDQIAALRDAIVAADKPVDEDILSKLTGKAATYFLSVLQD